MSKTKMFWMYMLVGLLLVLISLGFGRLSYGVVMPFMQDGLRLSYAQAGFLGTITSLGYLATVLLAGWLAADAACRLCDDHGGAADSGA